MKPAATCAVCAFVGALGFAAAVKGSNFLLMLWLLVERIVR